MTELVPTVAVRVTDREGCVSVLQASRDQTLMEALRDGGYAIAAICGGAMSCGTCHVYLDAATASLLSPAGRDEMLLLDESPHMIEPRSRLACQIALQACPSALAVELAPED